MLLSFVQKIIKIFDLFFVCAFFFSPPLSHKMFGFFGWGWGGGGGGPHPGGVPLGGGGEGRGVQSGVQSAHARNDPTTWCPMELQSSSMRGDPSALLGVHSRSSRLKMVATRPSTTDRPISNTQRGSTGVAKAEESAALAGAGSSA